MKTPTKLTSTFKQKLGYKYFVFQMNWARYVLLAGAMLAIFAFGYHSGATK